MKKPLPWLAILGGVAAVTALSTPPKDPPKGPHQGPLLPRLEFLKVIGAGQRPLVTSYYWIQTIYAVGLATTKERYLDVFHYADLVTDLDPKFYYAYKFTGTTIPMNQGRWRWENVHESQKILEKGIFNFPDDWKLRADLAFNLGFLQMRYEESAQEFDRAARKKGAPRYLSEVATRFFAHKGKFDSALALAKMMRDQAEDEDARRAYERRIAEIEQEMELQKLDEAIARFEEHHGRKPALVQELVLTGELPQLPKDPLGGNFYIDEQGRAQSDASEGRLAPRDFRREAEDRALARQREKEE